MPLKKRDVQTQQQQLQQSASAAAAADMALMETELLLSVLRSRLGRSQAVGEQLALENFGLADELAAQKLTLHDVNAFLTSELKARSAAAAQLEERVASLTASLATAHKEAQAEVARVRAQAAADVAAAQAGQAINGGVAASQQLGSGSAAVQLQETKARLEQTVVELSAALAARQKEYEARISDLERRQLHDKEKLRREQAAKIRETKLAMAQLADQHLEASTKRTLMENEAMAAELSHHAVQSHELVAANSTLREQAAELRRLLAVANKTAQSTAAKNLLLQHTIKSILACLKEEARLNAEAAITAAKAATTAPGPGQQRRATGSTNGSSNLGGSSHPGSPTDHARPSMFRQQLHGAHSMAHQHEGAAHCSHPPGPQPEEKHVQCSEQCDVVQRLEARVLQLGDELAGARHALAAAVHGALPQELQATCCILPAGDAGTAAAASSCFTSRASSPAASSCPAAQPGDKCRSRSSSPSSRRPLQRQQRAEPGSCRATCPGAGSPSACMAAALDDGVAAFVLFCVQHLRATSPGPAAAGSSTATAAADQGVGVLPAGEQLARLLLEQLHLYSRARVAAYSHLPVSLQLPGVGGGDSQQQQLLLMKAPPGSSGELSAHAATGSSDGAAQSGCSPASAPLPLLGTGTGPAGGQGRSRSPARGGARERLLLNALLSEVWPWAAQQSAAGSSSQGSSPGSSPSPGPQQQASPCVLGRRTPTLAALVPRGAVKADVAVAAAGRAGANTAP